MRRANQLGTGGNNSVRSECFEPMDSRLVLAYSVSQIDMYKNKFAVLLCRLYIVADRYNIRAQVKQHLRVR